MRIGLRRLCDVPARVRIGGRGDRTWHTARPFGRTPRSVQGRRPTPTGSIVASRGARRPRRRSAAAVGEPARRAGRRSRRRPAARPPPTATPAWPRRAWRSGNPVMIRIFKAESELELWMQKDDRFELFATYSICKWSGKLGPKLHEGDRQAPEGMYAVGMPQIHRKGRWPRSLNIGYPNAFDRAMDRTGSYILVHGGCSSTGCFAMTNPADGGDLPAERGGPEAGPDAHSHPRLPVPHDGNQPQGVFGQPLAIVLAQPQGRLRRVRAHARAAAGERVRQALRRARGRTGGRVEQASSVGTDPFDRADCIDTGAEVARMVSADDDDDDLEPAKISRARKVVSKTQRRRSAGRNARKAYAAARKARVALHAAQDALGCQDRALEPGLSPSEPRAAPGPARRRRPACRPPTPSPRRRPDQSS